MATTSPDPSSAGHDVKPRLVSSHKTVLFLLLSFVALPLQRVQSPLTSERGPRSTPHPTQNSDMVAVNHLAARCRILVVCPWGREGSGGEEGVKGGVPGSVLLQWSAMSRRAEEEQTSGRTQRRRPAVRQ